VLALLYLLIAAGIPIALAIRWYLRDLAYRRFLKREVGPIPVGLSDVIDSFTANPVDAVQQPFQIRGEADRRINAGELGADAARLRDRARSAYGQWLLSLLLIPAVFFAISTEDRLAPRLGLTSEILEIVGLVVFGLLAVAAIDARAIVRSFRAGRTRDVLRLLLGSIGLAVGGVIGLLWLLRPIG
jgi:hypothetical protein